MQQEETGIGKKWLLLLSPHWWALCTAGLALLLILSWNLKVSYEQAQQRALDNTANLSQMLDGMIASSLLRIDISLRQIIARIPREALRAENAASHAKEITRLLDRCKRQFPELTNVFVWDAEGNPLYVAEPAPPGVGFIALPPFQELKRTPALTNALSATVHSATNDLRVTAFYIPIRDAQGEFLAAISGDIHLEAYMQPLRGLNLPTDTAVSVRNSTNHRLMVHYPPIENEINQATDDLIQKRIDAGETSGHVVISSTIDGKERLYSFRKVSNYPVYVAAGIASSEILRDWRRQVIESAICVLLIVFLSGTALRRIYAVHKQLDDAKLHSEETLELLHGALDSVPLGMLIYDRDEKLVMVNRVAHTSVDQGIKTKTDASDVTFEEVTRNSLRQGFFLAAMGREEEYLAERLRQFREADGQPRLNALSTGRYIQYSDHHTRHGYTVCTRQDVTEQKRLENELRIQASTDALTNLPNRRYFMQQLGNELARVRRQPSYQACVLMLDLDFFKRVNDQHGHAAGDALLRHFSGLLRATLRDTDSASRMGGEEFAVILPNSDPPSALVWGQRLCAKVAASPMDWNAEEKIHATVSIGIAAIMPSDDLSDASLSRADQALYQAKRHGRNRVEIYCATDQMP